MFDIKYSNERDVELPMLFNFLSEYRRKITTLIDVGCYGSGETYARRIKGALPIGGRYYGLDLNRDPQLDLYLTLQMEGNVLFLEDQWEFDAAIAIGTLQTVGVIYHTEDLEEEREQVAHKLASISKHGLFFTFPFGQEGGIEGEYWNYTAKDLLNLIAIAEAHGFEDAEIAFFYNPSPASGLPWQFVNPVFAKNVQMKPDLGVRCVAIFKAWK